MQRVLSFPPSSPVYGGPDVIITKRLCIASMFSMGLITLLTGFAMGRYAMVRERLYKSQQCVESYSNISESVADTFILQSVGTSNLHGFIKSLNSPHSGNISDNLNQAQQMRQHFKDQGLDSVSDILPSQILLSYFKDDLNKVSVLSNDGDTSYRGTPLHFEVPQKTNQFEVTNITMGNVVYVNYGRESDFHYLNTKHISVKDTIVLARIGKVLPIDLVDVTLKRGAKGVILITETDNHSAYKSLLLPSQLGMLQVMHGNPSLARNNGVGNFGCVPVQIITAAVADKIFTNIFSDSLSPVDWRGNLSTFYSMDPDFTSQYKQLRMEVHMVNMEEVFYNVIGAIRGSHEPDRYVLVANNRQPLLGGGSEPLGGAASMMELVRVLADLKRSRGWQPRRTLVFCSWGLAQGDQRMTSTPLPEEWGHALESRAVGYISVEAAVQGNGSLSAQTTPLLTTVLFESASLVPNPRREEIARGRKTLYDDWLNTTRGNDNKPLIHVIRGTGDLRTIIHNHGIPTLDFQYANSQTTSAQLDVERDYKDVNHTYHCAITQLWGILLWKLSDSVIIPFDVTQYSSFLNHSVSSISTKYQPTILKHTLPLSELSDAVRNFTNAASAFQRRMQMIDLSNVLEVRIVNDQLLHVERSFLHHTTIDKTNTAFRHIVLSPGKYLDNDSTSGFGILQDLLSDLMSCPDYASLRSEIVSHLGILVHCVTSATFALQGSLEPLALVDL